MQLGQQLYINSFFLHFPANNQVSSHTMMI